MESTLHQLSTANLEKPFTGYKLFDDLILQQLILLVDRELSLFRIITTPLFLPTITFGKTYSLLTEPNSFGKRTLAIQEPVTFFFSLESSEIN